MLFTCRTNSAVCNKINELADNKQLKDVKEVAYFWTTNWYVDNNELIAKLIPNKDLTVAMVTRGVMTTAFFFEGCRGDALEVLNTIKQRKRGKTPHKVLVKMLFTRFRSLQGRIEWLKVTQRDVTDEHGREFRGYDYKVPVLTREELTPKNLTALCCGSTPHIREKAEETAKVLRREDMTTDVIDEAWELFKTSLVMDA